MSAHLADCDSLLERAGELTNAAEEARRALDARRTEVEAARGRLALVEEQREAAGQMIDDASRQLAELETSELDETSLRRELEAARMRLREAEEEHAEAGDALRQVEQEAANRAATRDHILFARADLVARVEALLVDGEPVRLALSAFDADCQTGEPDLVARELAREWIEVDGELERIESALPEAPSDDELAAAERRLSQIEQTIADLEAASRRTALVPGARDEIEAAHEAVLAAEEEVDRSGGHEDDMNRLHQAREVEHGVLRRHGYETYLDVILAGPRPAGDAQADLLDALRARRVAEDSLASCWPPASRPPSSPRSGPGATASTARPPTCWAATLGSTWPSCSTPTPWSRPTAPGPGHGAGQLRDPPRRRVGPRGLVSWFVEQDQELNERDECRRDIGRLDRDLAQLEDEEIRAIEHADYCGRPQRHPRRRGRRPAPGPHAGGRAVRPGVPGRAAPAAHRRRRAAPPADRRRHRGAAALRRRLRQLLPWPRRPSSAPRPASRPTAALSDAAPAAAHRRGAAPGPAPRAGDDPLGELPPACETLAAEVERAEVALAGATEDLERAPATSTRPRPSWTTT